MYAKTGRNAPFPQKRGGMVFRASLLAAIVITVALSGCARHGAAGRASPAPTISGADLNRGKAVFLEQCAACHGIAGMGGEVGPSLVNERAHRSYEAVREFVTEPAPPMPKLYPSRITEADVRDVSAYVESL
jgi:mono/diheme cytochrome c family protein